MPTIADARFDALRGFGHTGATNDMIVQWLQAGGATSNQVTDAWDEWLFLKGYGSDNGYQRNDGWYAWLGAQGHTGTLNDRELQFWISQAPP